MPVSPETQVNWQRRARELGLVLFAILSSGLVVGLGWILNLTDPGALIQATSMVAGRLVGAGIYGVLIDRNHARIALAASVFVIGAIASVYQLIFLGLGAVALIVGGVGIANMMLIAVVERRSEIGLRRALGATRRHILVQFLAKTLALSTIGGVAGVLIGALITIGYAASRSWAWVVPIEAIVGGLVATLLIGGIAGLYPAARAARLTPTQALRSS